MNKMTKILLLGFVTELFAGGLFILSILIGKMGPCGFANPIGYWLFYPALVLNFPAFAIYYLTGNFFQLNYIIANVVGFLIQWSLFSFLWSWQLTRRESRLTSGSS